MTTKEFVEIMRNSYPNILTLELLKKVDYKEEPFIEPETAIEMIIDANAEFREQVSLEINKSLIIEDRVFIRYLLEQEIKSHIADSWGVNENIKFCAYLLFKLGNVEDSLLIWQAKESSFDTFCGLDVQLIIGGGLDETISYLQSLASKEALDAAEYIEACKKTGDFTFMDAYRKDIKNYFEL